MMPVVFIGHGSPMNALEKNDFTKSLEKLGREIPRPKSILCISAHWMSEGVWVTHMKNPRTIHDFYGFPQSLFDIQYPAPGAVELAEKLHTTIPHPHINLDEEMWGIDHGAWSVLRHMYPKADIPLIQMSIYMEKPGIFHLQLGEKLRSLREEGVLIVGSGNIVHNLHTIKWEPHAEPYDWAQSFDRWAKEKIEARDFRALAEDYLQAPGGALSVPSPDHYYPLLYVLGSSTEKDKLRFEFEGLQNASISMRSFSFGM